MRIIRSISATDYLCLTVIVIISFILTFDLFLHRGQSATFDGPTHITNIAQFYRGLKEGEFPVRWGDGFARYGMPIPLIAQQFTSYLGAYINFMTNDVVLSYNFVVLFGAVLSTFLFYIFLRFYVRPIYALTGVFLFNFAPYRIMNIYIRGALPEFFAVSWLILLLISLYLVIEKKKAFGFILISLSSALIVLTHPFMMVVGSFIIIPYTLYLVWKSSKKIYIILGLGFFVFLGFGLTTYYSLPLFWEIKYFYYGLSSNHFVRGHFLSLSQFIWERWPYFYKGDIFTRGHLPQIGIIEALIIIISLLWLIFIHKQEPYSHKREKLFLSIGLLYIFFMTPFAGFFYENINILGNIQHPWRMLTGFILIPPILLSFLLNKRNYPILSLILIIAIIILRFPQLYGKNYTIYPLKDYFQTDDNLHGVIMNTIWMGEVRNYPYYGEKIKIIEGEGKILEKKITNSSRWYLIDAKTNLRIVDHTFYFPGWQLYIDGKKSDIQFQDPSYRGVITYSLSSGNHQVELSFNDTKPRRYGNLITLVSLSTILILCLIHFEYIYVFNIFLYGGYGAKK